MYYSMDGRFDLSRIDGRLSAKSQPNLRISKPKTTKGSEPKQLTLFHMSESQFARKISEIESKVKDKPKTIRNNKITTGSNKSNSSAKSNVNSSRSNYFFTVDEILTFLKNRKEQKLLATRPPFSYATMIAMALLNSISGTCTLSQLYQWISSRFPYYSLDKSGWQNSIRHNLSLSDAFVKTVKSPDSKGYLWKFQPHFDSKFFKDYTGGYENLRRIFQNIDHFFEQNTIEQSVVPKLVVTKPQSLTHENINVYPTPPENDIETIYDIDARLDLLKTPEFENAPYFSKFSPNNFPLLTSTPKKFDFDIFMDYNKNSGTFGLDLFQA